MSHIEVEKGDKNDERSGLLIWTTFKNKISFHGPRIFRGNLFIIVNYTNCRFCRIFYLILRKLFYLMIMRKDKNDKSNFINSQMKN